MLGDKVKKVLNGRILKWNADLKHGEEECKEKMGCRPPPWKTNDFDGVMRNGFGW